MSQAQPVEGILGELTPKNCKFVNEFQQVAVDTYLENWPGTPHICGDIKNVTGQQIMEMTGIKEGELDILDGSPPCSAFSIAGKREKGWDQEKIYSDGKKEGVQKSYFKNGHLKEVFFSSRGSKNGTFQGYYKEKEGGLQKKCFYSATSTVKFS